MAMHVRKLVSGTSPPLARLILFHNPGGEASCRRALALYEKAVRCGYRGASAHLDNLARHLGGAAPLLNRRVTIHGMGGALDGRCGEALDFNPSTEAYRVKLDDVAGGAPMPAPVKVAKGRLRGEDGAEEGAVGLFD